MRVMRDSGVEWIGEIPEGWETLAVKHLYRFDSGDNVTTEAIADEGEYPVYGANGLRGYYDRYNVQGPHILIGRQGALAGNVHTTDERIWATDHALVSTQVSDSVIDYYAYALDSANLNQYAFDKAAQPGLAASFIENLGIMRPPLDEQRRIADYLDARCADIDAVSQKVRSEIDVLGEYRKSVIYEAVTKGLDKGVPMRDSGIEWIGEIPEGWDLFKGKYVFEQRNEKGNRRSLRLLSPTQNYGVIPQDMYEELTGMRPVKLKQDTDLNTLKTIHKGDFCISLRSFQGGFEYSEYEGVVSPAYQVFYPIINVFDGYYRHLFKTPAFIDKMNSFTMSMRDGKNIAFDDFGNTLIPIPPIDEQRRIADYLDARCADIDAAVTKKRHQLAVLADYRKSLIYECVTGKREVA